MILVHAAAAGNTNFAARSSSNKRIPLSPFLANNALSGNSGILVSPESDGLPVTKGSGIWNPVINPGGTRILTTGGTRILTSGGTGILIAGGTHILTPGEPAISVNLIKFVKNCYIYIYFFIYLYKFLDAGLTFIHNKIIRP
jgi:hypothetical protein